MTTALRLIPSPRRSAPRRRHAPTAQDLAQHLLKDVRLAPEDLSRALARQSAQGGSLTQALQSLDLVTAADLLAAQEAVWGAGAIDPLVAPPDIRLVDRAGLTFCLSEHILPWRDIGGITVVATAEPEVFVRHRAALRVIFGRVAMALAPAEAIEAALLAARRNQLLYQAETMVPERESCRTWTVVGRSRLVLALLATLVVSALIWPAGVLIALAAWTVLSLVLTVALKLAAVLAALGRRGDPGTPPTVVRLPTVSIIVALFQERDIAPRLIRRLSRLDYPRDLLDIVLAVEEADHVTRAALAASDLPRWMRIVVVPDGRLKTKPRALNYALTFCRGSIIGIYDAEDAPEPDQIRKVVNRFHERGPSVACLQGVLDFYNPRTNWLSRCFTVEYATWFRLVLPGLERLGLAFPLGGTTLFFRRGALERVGGWDAHNVTEDADLGVRLARHGFRAELIETVTREEANCLVLPWIRQRSRWLKGYMMTWAVHSRDPVLLWRQLGAWRFLGVQVLFLGTISQYLLAPVLWSFWLVPFGVAHPVLEALPPAGQLALFGLFLATEAVTLSAGFVAIRRTDHRGLWAWVPTLHLYFPLGALASYKAVFELVRKPFFWDKTDHGRFDCAELTSEG